MPRFFVSSDKIDRDGCVIVISGDDSRHIARSLRMAVGDAVTVSDGVGNDYECVLTRIRDEESELKILSSGRGAAEPPAVITLYMRELLC